MAMIQQTGMSNRLSRNLVVEGGIKAIVNSLGRAKNRIFGGGYIVFLYPCCADGELLQL